MYIGIAWRFILSDWKDKKEKEKGKDRGLIALRVGYAAQGRQVTLLVAWFILSWLEVQ